MTGDEFKARMKVLERDLEGLRVIAAAMTDDIIKKSEEIARLNDERLNEILAGRGPEALTVDPELREFVLNGTETTASYKLLQEWPATFAREFYSCCSFYLDEGPPTYTKTDRIQRSTTLTLTQGQEVSRLANAIRQFAPLVRTKDNSFVIFGVMDHDVSETYSLTLRYYPDTDVAERVFSYGGRSKRHLKGPLDDVLKVLVAEHWYRDSR